jgi:hypothetical protein
MDRGINGKEELVIRSRMVTNDPLGQGNNEGLAKGNHKYFNHISGAANGCAE